MSRFLQYLEDLKLNLTELQLNTPMFLALKINWWTDSYQRKHLVWKIQISGPNFAQRIKWVQCLLYLSYQNTFLWLLTGPRTINEFWFYYAESIIKTTQITQGILSYQLGNGTLLWLETHLGRVTISHTSYSFLYRTPYSSCSKIILQLIHWTLI